MKDRCTDYMEGQGEHCACRDAQPPRDYAAMRRVGGWLLLFWLGAIVAWLRWWP